jgi:hypothetical protein
VQAHAEQGHDIACAEWCFVRRQVCSVCHTVCVKCAVPSSVLHCCRQLRELLLCALPKDVLGKGALSQVRPMQRMAIYQQP